MRRPARRPRPRPVSRLTFVRCASPSFVADVNPRSIARYGLLTSFVTVVMHWLFIAVNAAFLVAVGAVFHSADVAHKWCSWGALTGAVSSDPSTCNLPLYLVPLVMYSVRDGGGSCRCQSPIPARVL